ncbi:MAG: PaaI family thioesterase [Paracoccaceae bacterium]
MKIDAPIAEALLNQHGVAYVGFGLSLADTVARYAAIAHLPIGHNILTVESKINYLAPAKGDKLCAVGRVIRRGCRLSVVAADLFAIIEKNPTENCDFKINNDTGSP